MTFGAVLAFQTTGGSQLRIAAVQNHFLSLIFSIEIRLKNPSSGAPKTWPGFSPPPPPICCRNGAYIYEFPSPLTWRVGDDWLVLFELRCSCEQFWFTASTQDKEKQKQWNVKRKKSGNETIIGKQRELLSLFSNGLTNGTVKEKRQDENRGQCRNDDGKDTGPMQ